MKELKGHPQFVQMEDYYEDETYLYLLLERIHGCNLKDVMQRKKGEMNNNKEGYLKFILELLIKLAEALKIMSDKKIYHRDLHD